MKKKLTYIFILLIGIFLNCTAVEAKIIPKSGSFDCTYKLGYLMGESNGAPSHYVNLRITGNANNYTTLNFEWSDDTACSNGQECSQSLSELSNNGNIYINYSKLNITDFAITDSIWSCPSISYNQIKLKTNNSKKIYYVELAGPSSKVAYSAELISDNSVAPTQTSKMNINVCSYTINGSKFIGLLSSDGKINFSIDNSNANLPLKATSSISYSGTTCPELNKLTYCKGSSKWTIQYDNTKCPTGYSSINDSKYTCSYTGKINGKTLTVSKSENQWEIKYPDGTSRTLQANNVGENVLPTSNCEDILYTQYKKIIKAVDEKSSSNTYIYCNEYEDIEQFCENGTCKINNSYCGNTVDKDANYGECPAALKTITFFIKKIVFNIIQIFIPILLIVMGTLDLVKAVMASDDKAMKDAVGRLIKRIIYAVAIFFVVTIVTVIMNLFAEIPDIGAQNTWKACWFDNE